MLPESEKRTPISESPEGSEADISINQGDEICVKADRAFYGNGEAQNLKKARELYIEAYQRKSGRAIMSLAKMYETGIGVEKDYKKAFELYKEGANIDNPNPACMFALGKYYELELAPKEENTRGIHEALYYYEYAANASYPEAITKLAYMHENGIGCEPNKERAYAEYQEAAKLGDPLANNYLGLRYYNEAKKIESINEIAGKEDEDGSVAKLYEQAVELFKKAQKEKCARASNNLGMCYEQGVGVEKDIGEAYDCYLEAANQGFTQGMFNVAYLCLKKAESSSLNEDYEEAVYWFRRTLNNDPNYAEANFYLGFFFENGFGVDKDFHKALEYYKKADKQGFKKAAMKCGDLLLSQHELISSSKAEALVYYKKAIANDEKDSEAYLAIAKLYDEGGDGVKRDEELSLRNYEKARQLGNTDAGVILSYMYGNGIGVKKDIPKAKNILIESANRGNDLAMSHLIRHGVFTFSQKETIPKQMVSTGSFIIKKESRHGKNLESSDLRKSTFANPGYGLSVRNQPRISGGFTAAAKNHNLDENEFPSSFRRNPFTAKLEVIDSVVRDYSEGDSYKKLDFKDMSPGGDNFASRKVEENI